MVRRFFSVSVYDLAQRPTDDDSPKGVSCEDDTVPCRTCMLTIVVITGSREKGLLLSRDTGTGTSPGQ